MLTERLTFKAKYGHGDELVALIRESFAEMGMMGATSARIYTDRTGTMFTVVMEADYANLAAYATATGGDEAFSDAKFQEWFARMVAVTEGGERQLLNMEPV